MRISILFAQAAAEYGALGASRAANGGSRVSEAVDWAASATPGEWALLAGGVIVAAVILNRLFDAM